MYKCSLIVDVCLVNNIRYIKVYIIWFVWYKIGMI